MRGFTALLLVVLATTPAFAKKATADDDKERPTDAGWNGDWALTFNLNNILTQGSVLTRFNSFGTSATRFLTPDVAVRAGVSLNRSANTPQVTRTQVTTAGESIVTYDFNTPGTTSSLSTTVGGDVLWRLREGAVAPYVGAGLTIGHSLQQMSYADEITVPDQVTTIDNTTNSLNFGLRGVLGAEWRVHPNFAIFAEYGLSVTVLNWYDIDQETTVENTTGGTRTATHRKVERSVPVWFTFNNTLLQGGSLGLLVFF